MLVAGLACLVYAGTVTVIMTMPSSPRFRSVLSQRRAGAFTLLEVVVIFVIVALLTGLAAFGYNSVRRDSSDLAGKPTLGTVQAEARKLAATNSYQFPADLTTALTAQAPDNITYVSAPTPSLAPATDGGATFTVSVATTAASPSLAGYAVMTSPGHCTIMLDRTSAPSDDSAATLWVVSNNTGPNDCVPRLNCEQSWRSQADNNGTADTPLIVDSLSCDSSAPPPPASPSCLQAKEQPDQTILLTWTRPRVLDNITGYRLLRYEGSPSFTASNAANTSVNLLPAGFATGDGDKSTEATAGSTVTLLDDAAGTWEGNSGYYLRVGQDTGNTAALISNTAAVPVTANSAYTFSVHVARDTDQDFATALRPRISWFKADGSPSATPPSDGRTVMLSRTWAQTKVTGVAPSDAVTARVELDLDRSAASLPSDAYVRADGFVLEPGSEVTVPALPQPDRQWDVTGTDTTQAVDNSDLKPGMAYTWAVLAVSATGATSSVADLIASQQVLPSIQLRSSAATGFQAVQPLVEGQPSQALDVSWDRVLGADSYRVMRKDAAAPDTDYAPITVVPAAGAPEPARYSFTDTSVQFGSKYAYQIEPVNAALAYSLCGAFTTSGGVGEAATTVGPVYPVSPSVDGAAKGSGDTGRVNELWWSSPQDANDFEVSMRPAETPTVDRTYSDNGWLACSGPGSTETGPDTTTNTCLYAGGQRTEADPLAAANPAADVSGYNPDAVRADNQVLPGSKIYYRVRSLTHDGSTYLRSCWSNETAGYEGGSRTCTTKDGDAGAGVPVTQPLDPPTITAQTVGSGVYTKPVTLTWTPVTGATGYVVYRVNGHQGQTPENGPSVTGPQTTADPAWSAPGVSVAGQYSSAAFSPAIANTYANSNITVLGNGSFQFTKSETNPSQITYYVVAVRQPTSVFSLPTPVKVSVEPTAPTPVCANAAGGSHDIPISGVTGAGSGYTYNVYAYTSETQPVGDGVRVATGVTGPNVTHTVATLGNAFFYRTTVLYSLGGSTVESAYSGLSGFNVSTGKYAPCTTGLASFDDTESRFLDADGDGFRNDEVVSFDRIAEATHYVVVQDVGSQNVNAVEGAPVNNPTSYGLGSSGLITVLTDAQAAQLVPNSSPADLTFARGHTAVGFPAGTTRVNQGQWSGQFAATNSQMSDTRVFDGPGVFHQARTALFGVIADESGRIVSAVRTTVAGSPSVDYVPAPENPAVKMRYGTSAGRFISPVVSWSRGGVLADWYAQPFAITGVKVSRTDPAYTDSFAMNFSAYPNGLAAGAHNGTGAIHRVRLANAPFGSKAYFSVRVFTQRAPAPYANWDQVGSAASASVLGVAAPGTPSVTAVSDPDRSRVVLSWALPGNSPDAFSIFRSNPGDTSGSGWVQLADVAGTSRQYVDKLNVQGAQYAYQIVGWSWKADGSRVYSDPSTAGFNPVNHISSGAHGQLASDAPWEALYVDVTGDPTGHWVGNGVSGISGSWSGSYVVKGVVAYCIDLLDNSPQSSPSAYPLANRAELNMNNALAAGGGNLPKKFVGTPITDPVENYKLAYVLARYGSSYSASVTRAVDHYVRNLTVVGTGQTDWESQRWAKAPVGARNFFQDNLTNGQINPRRGPYSVSVSAPTNWQVDVPTPVTVTVYNGTGSGAVDSPLVFLKTDTAEPGWPTVMPAGANSVSIWVTPTSPDVADVSALVMAKPNNIGIWRPTDKDYQRVLFAGRLSLLSSGDVWKAAAGSYLQ